MGDARRVQLRAEKDGEDERYLDAEVSANGDLVINGQDLGPATAIVSPDGEYEWVRMIRRADVPALLSALGGDEDEDILDVLEQRYTGGESYTLEEILRSAVVPSEVHVL